MDKLDALDLHKTDTEIQAALERFGAKWQSKAEQAGRTDRISRF